MKIETFLLWMLFGMIAAFVAKAKGKFGWKWLLLMLLLGPIGFIAVYLPDKKRR
ncbi:MAG: hypothetical protein ACE14T_04885 [Syntrophales bacterium]